jgi:hypothetical protein
LDRAALDAALLAAHDAGDKGALISLYAEAAAAGGPGAAFYLTHAYVFALEAGDPRTASLRQRLLAMGAERD